MRLLYRISLSHPRKVLAVAVAVTLSAAAGLPRLTLRTDGHALVPADAPEVLVDRRVRDEFGIDDLVVILVTAGGPDGVFTPPVLRLVHELSRAVEAIDGIGRERVSSLDTEPSDRFTKGSIDFAAWLDPLPEDREDCLRLRRDILDLGVFTGTLVSEDGTATAIFAGVPPGADRTGVFVAVRALVAARSTPGATVRVLGAPVAEALLGLHILADLGVPSSWLGLAPEDRAAGSGPLLPFAVATMAIVFLLGFRRMGAVLLPLSEVAAALVCVFGLMGWLGLPVYLTTTILPVILTLTGVTDEIHIFAAYARRRRELALESNKDSVRAALDEVYSPVLQTAATTAAGFLSFALSPLVPVRSFGLLAAFSMVLCMVWSFTVVPALLALGRPEWFVRPVPAAPASITGAAARLAAAVARLAIGHRRIVVGLAIGLAACLPWGLSRLRVQDSWIGGFAPATPFYQAAEEFNRRFFGMHVLYVEVDSGRQVHSGEVRAADIDFHEVRLPRGPITEPAWLVGSSLRLTPQRSRPLGELEVRGSWEGPIASAYLEGDVLVLETPVSAGSAKFMFQIADDEVLRFDLESRRFSAPATLRLTDELADEARRLREKGVGGVLGPGDFLRTTRSILKKRDPAAKSLPDDPQEIHRLWHQYGSVRGAHRRRQVLDAGEDKALLAVYFKHANYSDTGDVLRALERFADTKLAPAGMRIALAGDVAVSQAMIASIVTTQVGSLAASLAGILAIVSIISRSLTRGLLSVVPCTLAVLANLAVMGWTDVPLGVATSMFASMTLGLGVDFAIHYLAQATRPGPEGSDPAARLVRAAEVTGPTILLDALAVGLGFGILILSAVPSNARLGQAAMVSVLSCLVSTAVILPPLAALVLRAPRQRAETDNPTHPARPQP